MPNDAFTIRALCTEFASAVTGSKISRIIQTHRDSFVLCLYKKGSPPLQLLLSAAADGARIHLTDKEFPTLLQPSGFCMTLRKYLLSGEIQSIQTLPFERIVCMTVSSKTELKDTATRKLYLEIFGRHSNMILCGSDDTIILPLRQKSLDMDGGRALFSRVKYLPPSPSGKLAATDSSALLAALKGFKGGDISAYLANTVAGLSLQSAAHIALRFCASTQQCDPLSDSAAQLAVSEIQRFDRGLSKKETLSPCIAVTSKGVYRDFFAFPYRTHDGAMIDFDSLNECADEFFYKRYVLSQLHSLRQGITSSINAQLKKSAKKIQLLSRRLEDCQNAELYKKYGELITANMHVVANKAQSITVPDFFDKDGIEITVPLQPELTAAANAQRYFKMYRKLKIGADMTRSQLDNALSEENYLNSVLTFAEHASDETTLKQISEELDAYRYKGHSAERGKDISANTAKAREQKDRTGTRFKLKGKTRNVSAKRKSGGEMAVHSENMDGFTLYVGKNNIQNDYITFRIARSDDIWLHVKGYHGAHVVISAGGKEVPRQVLQYAAVLAARGSQAKQAPDAEVDYCPQKNVKKAPGAAPGQVYYANHSTIVVKL